MAVEILNNLSACAEARSLKIKANLVIDPVYYGPKQRNHAKARIISMHEKRIVASTIFLSFNPNNYFLTRFNSELKNMVLIPLSFDLLLHMCFFMVFGVTKKRK